ncbi:Rap1-interacting factor 1 N terminal-domain-containing protein [Phyllosticta capitalensis]
MAPPFSGIKLRPPTPLRETEERIVAEACEFLSDCWEVEDATAPTPHHNGPSSTPLKDPALSMDSTAANSGKPKKVDFSPFTNYHRPDDLVSRRGTLSSPLRPLPQPKDHRTLKGILKPHTPHAGSGSPSQSQSAPKFDTFAEMLDSLVKQLASASHSHRKDSYVTLLSTLNEYDNTPDTQSLVDKMGLLAHFIQRDIAIPTVPTETSLLTLAQQALKLLCVLMNLDLVARHIPVELQHAFVKGAIQVFGDEKVPKRMVAPFLGAFAMQNFSSKIVDSERADTIVSSLQSIEQRAPGKVVLASRLTVYQKLLVQAPDVMVSRANDWLPQVLDCMVRVTPPELRKKGVDSGNSEAKKIAELRRKAIETGNSAAIKIGNKAKVSRLFMEMLDKGPENGSSLGRDYIRRIQNMFSDELSLPDVPKVWAIITLSLRGRNRDLHDWKLFQEWFMIIQRCLNSSNRDVVVNANAAWNRFVYAIRPDTSTQPIMRNLLRQGIALQLDRKAANNTHERSTAFSSYCTLLYYSLPPTASEEQLDLYWEEYVGQVLLDKMIKKGQNGANRACQVLANLFKSNNTGVWNENLALDIGRVTPGHLPGLDSKWSRRRLPVIFQLVQPCLSNASWDVPSAENQPSAEPPVCTMWSALMSTVAEAGSKEITTSMEFKMAIAHILNFLHRLWNDFPESLGLQNDDEEEWTLRFSFLVMSAMEKLGPLQFADPILTQKSPGNFEPASTTSNRSKAKGGTQSPLLFLLNLLATSEQPSALCLSKNLITLASNARVSRKPRLELLQNCVQETTASAAVAASQSLPTQIWMHITKLADFTLQDPSIQSKSATPSSRLGDEYRSVLAILTCGLQFGGAEVLAAATQLYGTIVTQVTNEAGNGAPSIAVTEPLAEAIVAAGANPSTDRLTMIGFATMALTDMSPPKDRRSLDSARKVLGAGPPKAGLFDPSDHLYKMIVLQLKYAYENLNPLDAQSVIDFVTSLADLLKRWPSSYTAIMLRKIQEGIAVWVEDKDKKLEGDGEDANTGKHSVESFWSVVMMVLMQVSRHDSVLLKALKDLIASGLNSRQRRVVNRTVETWNNTFGKEATLDYPPQVEKALRRLRPHLGVDLELPSFPSGPADEELGPAPAFEDSQESAHLSRKNSRLPAPTALSPHPSSSGKPSKKAKPSPVAKLRQQNSQINYAPIESSQQDFSIDSQLLTEHQKEVRDRQHGSTAVMFSDINSSPNNLPKRTRAAGQENDLLPGEGDGELRSTPIANLQSDGLDSFGGSSPTPKSRNLLRDQNYITSSAADRFFETEIPSSPPRTTEYVDLPPDSTFVRESFVESFHGDSRGHPPSGMSQDSPILIPSDTDDEQASRQLADESQARLSFRANTEDTHFETRDFDDEAEAGLQRSDSFDDLPQGTAEAAESANPSKILVDELLEHEADEVYSTPAGVRSQSPAQALKHVDPAKSHDASVVEDSFAHLDEKRNSPDNVEPAANDQPRPEEPPSTTKSQRKRARKRKNQAINEEGSTKRVKLSQSQGDEESAQLSIASSNIQTGQVDDTIVHDNDAPTRKVSRKHSSAQAQGSVPERPERSPSPVQRRRSKSPSFNVLKAYQERVQAQNSRVSPRLSGQVAQPPLPAVRKRKSRLSESQTIDENQEVDHEETNYGDISIDLDVVRETPAPKKRRGRPPRNRTSDGSEASQSTMASQETPDASGTGPTRGRGRRRRNSGEASGSSQQPLEKSDDHGSTAAAEARSTRSSKQKADNADTGDGDTAETETGRSRAEPQHDATRTSQASQASDGRRKKEPRSILGRLKQLLADAKSMVVGREEERECCDVMFELQREVHEAARRGEAQDQ